MSSKSCSRAVIPLCFGHLLERFNDTHRTLTGGILEARAEEMKVNVFPKQFIGLFVCLIHLVPFGWAENFYVCLLDMEASL